MRVKREVETTRGHLELRGEQSMGKTRIVLQPPLDSENKASIWILSLHLPTHPSIKSTAQGSSGPPGSHLSIWTSQSEHKLLVSHRASLCVHSIDLVQSRQTLDKYLQIVCGNEARLRPAASWTSCHLSACGHL